jgi:hypothetical protein
MYAVAALIPRLPVNDLDSPEAESAARERAGRQSAAMAPERVVFMQSESKRIAGGGVKCDAAKQKGGAPEEPRPSVIQMRVRTRISGPGR